MSARIRIASAFFVIALVGVVSVVSAAAATIRTSPLSTSITVVKPVSTTAAPLAPISDHEAECTTMLLNARWHVRAMIAAENAGDEASANAEAEVANSWMDDYKNAGCDK